MTRTGAFKPFATCCLEFVTICLFPLAACFGPAKADVTDNILTVPIYGNVYEYAYYFIDIYVGSSTPPQKQSVILDSGSSLLAFPCNFCEQCGAHLDPPFDMNISPSAEFVPCDGRCPCEAATNRCKYEVEYEEGSSIQGYYIRDFVRLESSITDANRKDVERSLYTTASHSIRLLPTATQRMLSHVRNMNLNPYRALWGEPAPATAYFGCHRRETNQFLSQQASGVMGISFRSDDEEETVMNSIFNAHGVNRRMFSVCLAHFGGLLSIGGFNSAPGNTGEEASDSLLSKESFVYGNDVQLPQEGKIVFAPMVDREAYAIMLESMTFDGELIASTDELSEKGGAMLDTGTTYTLLPSIVLERILYKLEKCGTDSTLKCQGTWSHVGRSITDPDLDERCWKIANYSDIASFPEIKIRTAGGEISFKGESYLYPRMRSRIWCLGLKEHFGNGVVLGATFFTHHNIIFDLDNYQIGFVDARCPTIHLQKQHGASPQASNGETPILRNITLRDAGFPHWMQSESAFTFVGAVAICFSLLVTATVGGILVSAKR